MANSMQGKIEFSFLLPNGSEVAAVAMAYGYQVEHLPMVEIGRSVARLILYAPALLLNGIRMRALLVCRPADVIIANDYYNLLPAMARLLGWRGRIVTIVRLLPRNQNRLLNCFWTSVMQLVSTAIVSVSLSVQKQLPRRANAQLIYFPVGRGLEDLPYVSPQETESVRFVYLSNYIRGKGLELGLKAFAEVVATNPFARLAFVGGDMGLRKNAIFRDELIQQAQILGVAKVVEFNGSTDDVARVIGAADVVLNFSDSESFSHTCLEAALLGRPVIATRCGGPEEIVENGITGILVGLRDIDEMVCAMRRLAGSADERLSMGRQAFVRARMRFGSADFADKFTKLLLR